MNERLSALCCSLSALLFNFFADVMSIKLLSGFFFFSFCSVLAKTFSPYNHFNYDKSVDLFAL